MQRDDDLMHSTGCAGDPDDSFHLVDSRRRAFEILRSAVFGREARPDFDYRRIGRRARPHWCGDSQRRIQSAWRTATVDLAAEMNALDFLRLVGHALGVVNGSRLGKARLRLQAALANEAAEGRRWLLVVDRADRGRSGVWDEVQAIASQLGRSRGFAALFIVGETGLALRSLARRRSSMGLASQVRHSRPSETARS